MTAFPRYNIIMKIQYAKGFDYYLNDDTSRVFQLFPDSYKDERGYFMEVIKDYGQWPYKDIPMWLSNLQWIRQINRSSSKKGVIRGCHAQRGIFCQGKLVEAVTDIIFDIITDMRPDSKSFGSSEIFKLDPEVHNLLWVPRGFLHCVIFPKVEKSAILQYYCDQTYDKNSEFCVNPVSLIPDVVKGVEKLYETNDVKDTDYDMLFDMFKEGNEDKLIYSEKDTKSMDYEDFVIKVKDEYEKDHRLWFS